jgi:2-polyprenyl-3-methyl-5-hydroxy-6-metoxy-1,4-benzoquinol methylase
MSKELKKKYEDIYLAGKEDFFSKFKNGVDDSETEDMVWNATNWKDKMVIDIGCGTGEIAAGIYDRGAEIVFGVDYAINAIKIAKKKYESKGVKFINKSLDDFSIDSLYSNDGKKADVVLSLGTIEHMDSPEFAIKKMTEMLGDEGELILTCPHFINVRGLIWMTLALTLDVPMSLTDKHFISPFDIRKWLKGTDFYLAKESYFDFDRANGEGLIVDMDKRLTNALNDKGLPSDKVPVMLEWLSNLVSQEQSTLKSMNGATALYLIKRKEG